MALPLQCSLLQNPSLSPPSPSSSSQSHLLLLCDFVRGCRILRSYHISLRRNISSTVFCSVSGDRNLGPSASSAKRTSTEKEWSQPEPASPSETGTAARARSSIETISLGIKDPVYEDSGYRLLILLVLFGNRSEFRWDDVQENNQQTAFVEV